MAELPLLLFTHPESGELLRRRWRLMVVDGPDRPKTIDINESPTLVGAAPAAGLVLTDDTVSRYHTELEIFADGLRLRDLDSTNGTFLEADTPVRTAFLENGANFRVGRTTIRIIGHEESTASEIETDPRGTAPGQVERCGPLLGVAASTREIFRQVRRASPSRSAILLYGPPGVGKKSLARRIHELSPRRLRPFVTCAAGPSGAQLFGLVGKSGETLQVGLFDLAEGGTLFLEDVDKLSEPLQTQLLAVLERGEVSRQGEDRPRKLDVRLVSTTTKDPARLAHFDKRLARRLSVVKLSIPGFSERREDIVPLARHLLQERGRDLALGPRTTRLLEDADYPDNVRALARYLDRLTQPSRLGPRSNHFDEKLRGAFLDELLQSLEGNVSAAARRLAIPQPRLFAELDHHRIELGD